MNHKRKSNKRRVWRKMGNRPNLTEWSRMLHLWWKRNVIGKLEFKKYVR